jgi:putative ABC transport system permease protein
MILWKFTWNEFRRRPGRAALTLLSIVIAVAAVVSVSVATSATRRAYDEMFRTVTGRADLEIMAAAGGAFDESTVALAEKTDGVQLAVPLIQRYTIMYWDDSKTRLTALGIDLQKDKKVRNYRRTSGRGLDKGAGIWLDAAVARRFGLEVGDEVKLLARIGLERTKLVGLFEPRGGSAVAQGGQLMMSLERAQRLFGAAGQVDRVLVVLEEWAEEEQVVAELGQELAAGLKVRQPATHSQFADETLFVAEQGLRLATALALLTAVFIVVNTFRMNVGERRGQLAVIRAVGGTRGQVGWMIYREALTLATAGIVLGVLAGLGGAQLLSRAVERLMQTSLPPGHVTGASLALAVLFGLGISLVGAYLPARRAMKLTPLEAMRVLADRGSRGVSARTFGPGLAVVAVAVVLLAASVLGWLPTEVSVPAAVALLIGAVMLVPPVLNPFSRMIEHALSAVLGVERRLGRRQLLRHRGRTSLTVGVLFVTLSLGIGLANSIVDNVADVKHWYQQVLVGDFFVRAMMPEMATGTAADVPEGLGKQIAAIRGVTDVDPVRFVSAEAAGQRVIVVVRQFDDDTPARFDLAELDNETVRERLERGQVVIGSVLAHRANLQRGDDLPMPTREGKQSMRIAGITEAYLGGGLTVYMDRDTAERLLGIEGVDALVLRAEQGSLGSVEAELEDLCEKHGLMLQSYSDLIRSIDRMMSGVVGSLWGLLTLGLLVASFGVVNTLTMNVLEQTREFAVLRVVAMTRRQLRRVIFAQAAILGLLGLLPGSLAGIGVAYLINLSTYPVTGHAVQFVFHPWLLTGCFMMAMAIVIVAAWAPAERAARLPLAEALRYE